MQFLFAIFLINVLLTYQPAAIQACDTANWYSSLDKQGWSVCPNDRTYLKGFWRNDPSGHNGIWLLEHGKCCLASESSYTNQPSTCKNANWWGTLDSNHRWALCPNGYYLEGLYRSASSNGMLHNIEEGKCCRPQNHPDSYGGCYDEDVGISFDRKGWSECKQAGYYMTGFYKGSCDKLYCIEKFRCCKMKKVAVNGGWSDFGAWGECSAACGDGQQERSRTCTNPPPSNGGAQCSGSSKETRPCNNGPCPLNGGWSDFGEWGECSVACGGGKQERTRTCTNPPPAHGGNDCVGNNKEEQECNTQPCEVDGSWSAFGDWSECSVTCGGGIRERRRTCTSPPPSNGGACCVGDNVMAERCNIEPCEAEEVDGGWSQWSAYGECKSKKNCGKGKKTRTRTCTNPPPSGGGSDCKGKSEETKKCKLESCKG